MIDYEKLGVFYLGREFDLAGGQPKPELVLYDSKDLTTHAVIVGMTGSGKTGLGITLLEEAAIDQIPAIIIDPKGDLGNLLLNFPELKPADFRPWIEKDEAARKGLDQDQYAQQISETWRKGLKSWDQEPSRIQKLRDAAEVVVYTPGSDAGLPISVLKSFDCPSDAVMSNSDALRERISAASSGLLALLGISADPLRSREHILISNIFDQAWRAGRHLTIEGLIREIQSPPFQKIGVMDLESIYPAADRLQLAMTVNNVLASPGFSAWTQGEPLNIQRLLYSADGRPRLSILSIAHLSDNERMFFVTILLNEVISWMRAQPGTSSLRALLYMDEVFGYLPPTANPPSKVPMLTLLKQARAYGLGLVLASQNPVDLDYKALSNAGTWFLGRLQTERDKARVLDGLEGASTSAGQHFDRATTEKILSGLANRVFLMNNVHEDAPVVFQTRWALSYLRGPLTRDQIATLMAPLKAAASPGASLGVSIAAAPAPSVGKEPSNAPILPAEIEPEYVPISRQVSRETAIIYHPAVLGRMRLHYVDSKADLDYWCKAVRLSRIDGEIPADVWEGSDAFAADRFETDKSPAADAKYGETSVELTRAKSYASWTKSLKDFAYRDQPLMLSCASAVSQFSKPGESEGDFRGRLTQQLRERRDTEIEKLRGKYASKIATLKDRIARAQDRVEAEKNQARSAKVSAVASMGATIFGALFGRKLASSTNVGKAATSMRSASRAAEQNADVGRAEEKVETLQKDLADLEQKLSDDIESITNSYTLENVALESYEVRPRKSDITIEKVTLAWLPYAIKEGTLTPAWES